LLVRQNVISSDENRELLLMEGERFVNRTKFDSALKESIETGGDEKKLSLISSAFTEKGVPARLTTFIFALITAVLATFLVKPKKDNSIQL
jgi:hypothetical protein